MKRAWFIGSITVMAALAVVAVDGWRRAHATQRLLEQALAQDSNGRGAALGLSERTPPARGVVYVDGAVARPGVYQLPEGGRLTASRLMTAAGGTGTDGRAASFSITRFEADERGTSQMREYRVSAHDAESFVMQPDDRLVVAAPERGVVPTGPQPRTGIEP